MRNLLVAAVILFAARSLPAEDASGAPAHKVNDQSQPVVSSVENHEEQSFASKRVLVVTGIYCGVVVLASLLGGWVPMIMRPTHTRLQISMSLCGGLMLGIGLLHMLPHAYAVLGSVDRVVWWVMIGLLCMFFLIRAFHFHQHESADGEAMPHDHEHSHDVGGHGAHWHAASHGRSLVPPTDRLSWIGVVVGLGIHTMIDGMALGASVQADAVHEEGWFLGFGTFLAIVLHKPLDTVPIAILMRSGQASARLTHLVNGAFSILCPVGVAMFFLGLRITEHQSALVGCAPAFSAGVFICIALSDLLPELEFHSHDRFKLSLALLIGVAIAYAIGFFEPEHAHETERGAKRQAETARHQEHAD